MGHPRHARVGLLAVAASLAVAGCAVGSDEARLHAQAKAALTRYADAVASSGGGAFQPAGELTGQVGIWEAANGDNKVSLMGGYIEAAAPLPTAAPPDGTITWSDGSSTTVPLLSAAAALEQIRVTATGGCLGCDPTPVPIEVTGASLTTVTIGTSRGQATVPAWSFTLAGTSVRVTRVAVARTVQVVPPPWDPNNAPIGPSIEKAALAPDGRTLTVTFVGAPDPASKPCGEDYTAEPVESDLAVVVIVVVHRNPLPASCLGVGAERTATATLTAPLGGRAVLEVMEGLPVPVTRG